MCNKDLSFYKCIGLVVSSITASIIKCCTRKEYSLLLQGRKLNSKILLTDRTWFNQNFNKARRNGKIKSEVTSTCARGLYRLEYARDRLKQILRRLVRPAEPHRRHPGRRKFEIEIRLKCQRCPGLLSLEFFKENRLARAQSKSFFSFSILYRSDILTKHN